jgi:CheY-like chemotaxis protein
MDGRRRAVLLVEDDHEISGLVAEILEVEGFSVATARNGRVGLELLRSAAPDVVLLDLMMPELDGFGFLAGYRELPPPRPPVLASSAFEGYLPVALEQGAAAVLKKPYDLDDLLAAVSGLADGGAPTGLAEPVAADERDRLRAVLELKLDQPAPTAAMDAFVQRVARIFEVPICLVSIVTRDRQYWHAFCGLPSDLEHARGTPRSDSFCTHAVVANASLVVQDARENPFFADNAFVRERGLRFYAGVPIVHRFGHVLGTLCLLDMRPRTFTAFDLELQSVLAKRIAAELEWREKRRSPTTPDAAFRYLSWLDEEHDILGREAFVQALQVEALRASERRADLSLAVASVAPGELAPVVARLKGAFPRAMLGRLGYARVGVLAFGDPADAVAQRARAGAGASAALAVVRVPRIAGGAESFLHCAEQAAGAEPAAGPLT